MIQFPKELPSWGIFDTDQLRNIRNLLCQPAPGLKFSEETAEAVRERLLRLPRTEGFEAVQLFSGYSTNWPAPTAHRLS